MLKSLKKIITQLCIFSHNFKFAKKYLLLQDCHNFNKSLLYAKMAEKERLIINQGILHYLLDERSRFKQRIYFFAAMSTQVTTTP
jgi:hypothetical protein